jgi:FemAB family
LVWQAAKAALAGLDHVAFLNMTVLNVLQIAPNDWPALAAGFRDLSFEQTFAYAEAAARRIGAKLRFYAVVRDGHVVAATAVRIKTVPGLQRGIAWIASGPLVLPRTGVVPDEAMLASIFTALCAELGDRQGHVLRLRLSGLARLDPEAVARATAIAGLVRARRAPGYRSAAVDLSRDRSKLMEALNGKWRTDLRFAQKSGLVLERGSGAKIEARFLAMFDEVQAAKGFRPEIPPQFHFKLGGPDYAVETLIAAKEGKDVAGIVIGSAGGCTTYLFGATTDAGRPLRAGYFLTWEAVCLAQDLGMSWYDLGGIDAVMNPDVARFKERINGCSLLAEPFEQRPTGLLQRFVLQAEALRAGLRQR